MVVVVIDVVVVVVAVFGRVTIVAIVAAVVVAQVATFVVSGFFGQYVLMVGTLTASAELDDPCRARRLLPKPALP